MSTRISVKQSARPALWRHLRNAVAELFPAPASSSRALPAPAIPEFHGTDTAGDLRVGLVGIRGATLSEPARWLRGQGIEVGWLEPAVTSLGDLAAPEAPNLAIIDVDALGGADIVLEPLLNLRRRRPGLAVVLVSRLFRADDVSLERLPVCDCSLRAPVSFAALDFAVGEAVDVNNPLWVERVRHLSLS